METQTNSNNSKEEQAHQLASQIVDYFRTIPGGAVSGADPVLQTVLKLSNRFQTNRVDMNLVGAVTTHAGHLLSHSKTAGELQTYFLDEIDTRTSNLRDCLATMIALLDDSSKNAETLENRTNASIAETAEGIRTGLDDICAGLEQKSKRTSETLDAIADIGQSINLLAVNANIEAARAGEHGHAFSIVAQEVRALAQKTMERTEEAVRVVDLTETTELMNSAIDTAKGSLDGLGQLVANALTELREIFRLIEAQQQSIDDNSQIIFEMLSNTRVAQKRGHNKVTRAQNDMKSGVAAIQAGSLRADLGRFLSQTTFWRPGQPDMLERILRSQRLRVGVEPNFVGLSFRPEKHGKLQGLDVEYARAFADWLKVDVEFVEHDWDQLTELLYVGPSAGMPPVDLVWSALPPSPTYNGVAYSNTYTYLPFALCRRKGDDSISDIASLDGKILGIINDPGAFDVLQDAGLRWAANREMPGKVAALANLVPYSDQSRIHDCLVEGAVDAFAVDLPIYYWACQNPDSPWFDKIEILPTILVPDLYYYAVATRAQPDAYRLLAEVNRFIDAFLKTEKRAMIERNWQGKAYTGEGSYRDDPATAVGERELRAKYEALIVDRPKPAQARVA